MPSLTLSSPVQYVKGVGPKVAAMLKKLEVLTVNDLIFFLPRDYFDRRDVTPISKVSTGNMVIVKGSITKVKVNRTRRGFSIIKAAIMDKTGVLYAVWFNQPYLQNVLKRGLHILASGKTEFNSYDGEMELVVRDWEVYSPDSEAMPILAKYPLTEGLFQKKIRAVVRTAIDSCFKYIVDPLSQEILSRLKLMELKRAIVDLHFPEDIKLIAPARHRLVFDDFFFFQLGLLFRRGFFKKNVKGIKFKVDGELLKRFISSLPFKLTAAQERVFKEISSDMESEAPMARLLQGDVGSGKTVIALLSAVLAAQNGYQSAIMAPTEILAQQHFRRARELFSSLGIKAELLISGIGHAKRKSVLERISSGEVAVVIGTHAVIEEDVAFKNLGFVVIDEQHRFGVLQRASLCRKGINPDILVMTATPIPRSLALTLFGDLDRSVIDELPPGRTPVKTVYVDENRRPKAYEFMRAEMKKGKQVFLVCPLIEESETLDIKAARAEAEALKKVFPEFNVGLLHGKLKNEQKEEVLRSFVCGKTNILVSTTVIEVGIDYPNATIMLIEHAERFGLSQLHQLRGRIGRGSDRSYCLLCADPKSEEGKRRIQAMLSTSDGFKIAEEDLKIRGPGDFCGVRQAGLPVRQAGLPVFRIADIIMDSDVLSLSRAAALDLLKADPRLSGPENKLIREELEARHGKFLELEMLN
jgi:ATP-dependent DNA helicase RecG